MFPAQESFPVSALNHGLGARVPMGQGPAVVLLLPFVNSLHMSLGSWFDCVIFSKQTLFCFRASAPQSPWAQLLQDVLICGASCASTLVPEQPGCAFYVRKPSTRLCSVCFPDSQALPHARGRPWASSQIAFIAVYDPRSDLSLSPFNLAPVPWRPATCPALCWVPQSRKK